MRVVVIANPAAGGVSGRLVWQVVRRCRGPVSVRWTEAPGDATAIARRATDSADLVVSVGGDGTAREVAAGLATAWRPAVPMLMVPGGTANSLYRTLWREVPWPVALGRALAGQAPAWLDLARLDDRLVLAGASTGFSPRVIHRAKTVGCSYPAAIAALAPGNVPYRGRVLVDGVEIHSGPTLVANIGGSRYRGGNIELLPHTSLDDGLLDVCVVGGELSVAEILPRTRTGTHLAVPGVVYARGRTITVASTDDRPLWFEHDGEVLPRDRTSYTLTAVPAAVPMLTAGAVPALAA